MHHFSHPCRISPSSIVATTNALLDIVIAIGIKSKTSSPNFLSTFNCSCMQKAVIPRSVLHVVDKASESGNKAGEKVPKAKSEKKRRQSSQSNKSEKSETENQENTAT